MFTFSKESLQMHSGAAELGLGGVFADLELFGDLFVGVTIDGIQVENRAIPFWQYFQQV